VAVEQRQEPAEAAAHGGEGVGAQARPQRVRELHRLWQSEQTKKITQESAQVCKHRPRKSHGKRKLVHGRKDKKAKNKIHN
jgi:hypothetical protein